MRRDPARIRVIPFGCLSPEDKGDTIAVLFYLLFIRGWLVGIGSLALDSFSLPLMGSRDHHHHHNIIDMMEIPSISFALSKRCTC